MKAQSQLYPFTYPYAYPGMYLHVFEKNKKNTILYFEFKCLWKKIECILYLNTFNRSIFVFSKYFLPINLFIRLLISCIN